MTITVEGPGGATVEFPDGTSSETINKAMTDHFGTGEKKEASGVLAGAVHGVTELINGPAETAKRFAGVGAGRVDDPNYVPANVTNGSWNPANWSLSQLPQKVAEMAPSAIPDVAAGTAGAKLGKKLGGIKGAALGALLGATLSGTARTAGDTAKEVTVARTGDANAESNNADLVRGGATAAASSVAAAALPTRLVPGMSTLRTVGAQGAGDAAKRWLGTTAIGGAGAVASDATKQAGLTVGTDKGLTIDPSSFPESAVGGAATGAVLGAPKMGFDTGRAVSLREHGGANLEATKNYATRLNEEGQGKLGDKLIGAGQFDQAAHDNTVFGIRRELGDAASNVRRQLPGLSEEAHTALAKAESNKPLSAQDIDLIDSHLAAAPDGANASYLARTMRMAQLAAERGQNGGKSGWTGGISGVADANIGYMLNPFRAATGAAMSLGGAHLLGVGSPYFAGTALGLYSAARLFDAASGRRSPAKTFAEHFADQNATLRQPSTPGAAPAAPAAPANAPWGPRPPMAGPTGPQVAPQAPQQAPQGPWGPKPMPTQSVPTVQPQASAPAPTPPAPVSPMALMMLKQKLKAGLPPEPTAPAPAPEPAPINPLMLPRDITAPSKSITNGWKNSGKLANTYDTATRKADGVAQAEALAAESPTISEAGGLEGLISPDAAKHGSKLLGIANVMRRLSAAGPEEVAAGREEAAQAKVSAREEKAQAKEAQKLALAQLKAEAKPKTIKKVEGKAVTEEAPAPKEEPKAYEPFEEHEMIHPKGVTAKQYADTETANYGASSPRYTRNAERSAQKRIDAAAKLSKEYPSYRHSFAGLLRQLHEIGTNAEHRKTAVEHYASHVPDDVGAAMREAFK